MKKKILLTVLAMMMVMGATVGCTEAGKVSQNVSQEADNFNVLRRFRRCKGKQI
jgi:hypothetical protein